MNALDIFICVVVAIGLFRGVVRGLIKEAASIVGVVTGFYVAIGHYHVLTPMFSQYIKTPETVNLLAFFVLFFSVLIGVAAIGSILKYVLKIAHLGNVDKVFGGILGLIKGILVSAAVVFALTMFLPSNESGSVGRSRLAPVVTKSSKFIIALVPEKVMQGFSEKTAEMKKKWEAQDE
ncbi:CvpA family protein [Desulfatibacillum aliphaticivorans]|uniref:CvpA family protein n=1 Tax=Desulfatibacillum aliphaticivorans TaxID=218208 RepID=UPI0003FFBB26|nr:CvpA family protein [Desulfatibacillum aliphaticivorans]